MPFSAAPSIAKRGFGRTNPTNGKPLPEVSYTSSEVCETAIYRGLRALSPWSAGPIEARLEPTLRLRQHFLAQRAELAELITREIGKPLAESEREVDKAVSLADYYLAHAAAILRPRTIQGASGSRLVRSVPLGLIVTISPANFPLWQVFRAALPIVLAGNVVLNKPAPSGDTCARALAALFKEAGFSPGVFQTVQLPPSEVSALIRRSPVRGVAFTGGREAGQAVGAAAGEALKPVVLELGGNDPALLLEDANLDEAIDQCVRARTYNNGQTCLGPKRLIVAAGIYEAAVEKARVLANSLPHGDPFDRANPRGPLCSLDARARLHAQVVEAVREGATLVTGGELPSTPGAFYPVTVLRDVERDSIVYREELFGPVIALTPTRSDEEAIALANATPFGLGSSIFTASRARAEKISRQLEVANIGWNRIPRSGPEFPFGGIKESGFGRELGEAGLLAFTNQQVLAGFSDEPTRP